VLQNKKQYFGVFAKTHNARTPIITAITNSLDLNKVPKQRLEIIVKIKNLSVGKNLLVTKTTINKTLSPIISLTQAY
jgi:hypothetical protein